MESPAAVSLNTKLDPKEKELFVRTAERLGMTASGAVKVFVRMFNECGGFPFEVRVPQSTESVTYVGTRDFETFARALEEPMPAEVTELLERKYEWAE